MTATKFGGVWRYHSLICPGQETFMCIDDERHRMITFEIIRVDPLWRVAIRHWYEHHSDTSIRARLRPDSEWQILEYKLDGEELHWFYGGEDHPWLRIQPKDYPEWLNSKIEAAYRKMDELEERLGD